VFHDARQTVPGSNKNKDNEILLGTNQTENTKAVVGDANDISH
jgi:hypothetical protein